jgi:hypothetical protein
MNAYIVEAGYYEDRRVAGVALTYEAAERLAESIHPQIDHFFGTDPRCEHWQRPEKDGDCKGCTVSIGEWEVYE